MSKMTLYALTLTITLFQLLVQTYAQAAQVRFLQKDDEAIQARADLIQQAKSEIYAEYFAVTNDSTATGAFALLRQAARRGIKVKIIMDALSSHVKAETLAAILDDGKGNLEIKVVNPGNLLNPQTLTQRDHAKMLNIDGEVMIVGGRNVDNKYFGLDSHRNFIDLDILISGSAVTAATQYYKSLWNQADEVKAPDLKDVSFKNRRYDSCTDTEDWWGCQAQREAAEAKVLSASKRLDKALEIMQTGQGNVRLNSGTNWLAPSAEVFEVDDGKISFLANSPEKAVGRSNQVVADELFRIVDGAQNNVLILSPYLIPTDRASQMFVDLRQRQIPVTIITNSLLSTDNLFAQAGYQVNKPKMINLGIELYEYNIFDTTHAKAAVIDDTVMIGTYNLDPRSAGLNREIGIVIFDETKVAQKLTGIIQSFQANSLLVGKDGRAQNENLQNQNIPAWKKAALPAIKAALPLFYDQL